MAILACSALRLCLFTVDDSEARRSVQMAKGEQIAGIQQKRAKVPQTDFPASSLEQALRIANALWDHFAGKGAAPHDVALALDLSPTSGGWRNLCGASIAYGLTEGGYAADQIVLTELGRRIVAPTEDGQDTGAKVEAIIKPRIMGEFLQKYDRAKFPRDDIAKNVLASMGLPKERADKALDILKENGFETGVIRDTKTGPFVAIAIAGRSARANVGDEASPDIPDVGIPAQSEVEEQGEVSAASTRPTPRDASPSAPKKLFVAHGKNRKPLLDLKGILDQFKIPYKVAVDEPNQGRPISAKVAELMNDCSAGIFIFTRDEQFFRAGDDGEHIEIWRPSENVVYELGAASILWDRKIIILREDGVNFPSDFSDLGYITFKDGEIATKALDILKELFALELVKLSPA